MSTEHEDYHCDPGYEQCVSFSREISEMAAEIKRLRGALEGAAVLAEAYWREVEDCKAAHYRYTDAPFLMSNFSYNPDLAIHSKQLGQRIRDLSSPK